ncbi:plasma-membrane proton-efflux P-type ATPase [Thiomicrorhabdus sp.]|uniref:plasma-membrane proton-efflux P-type ATPase n=1 Tax=Thiomicrorhabdus sp. TaxID=2039724 RepID=UPI002AA891B0|nr:plasma-membrane proton-efflux P-type ATPase [Thiomicrorhabdus sp.]
MNSTEMKSTDYYLTQSIEDSLSDFQVNSKMGLSSEEAQKRLEQFGANQITEKEEPLWHRFFKRFWGPIPWMIETAALLSAFLQKWEDFVVIVIMLLINVLLDFFQEHRALNALKVLKQQITQKVRVLRDGEYQLTPAKFLVPGDIIRLRIGDVIPADVQLLSGDFLSIDESSLTGESLPVTKRESELGYSNTVIKQGEMLALVVNTGGNTRFNSVVALVAKASLKERSHFQKMVIKIGNFLIFITLILVVMILIMGLFRGEDLFEIARFSLVLTVAAIPVALPAVLSVTMAVGALTLARKKAIVSRLTAIEELAGVDVFCSDKTGTLTKNEMQVAEPIVFEGHTEEELFIYAVMASKHENQDPIEIPLFHYLDEKYPNSNWTQWQQNRFTPFNPVSKQTSAKISFQGKELEVYKGAAQVLLDLANLSENALIAINQSVKMFADKGYRTLAVGVQELGGSIKLVGLIPLIDPERADSAQVIQNMRDNGVQVKMITGDNVAIAEEIGRRLGLSKRSLRANELTGKASHEFFGFAQALSRAIYQKLYPEVTQDKARDFADDVMVALEKSFDMQSLEKEFVHTHESVLIDTLEAVDIFAEVRPEDKYTIIETLQKASHIVGMTGDGVNDAPALKKADCGFAVSNATDAARAAADIVLTSPGLSVINNAIDQARITFERMKSYATFRVAESIRIILFMALSILLFNFYPITTLMIILLALLNDIPILAIAYDNTKISKRPVKWNLSSLLTVSSVLGVAGVISSFMLYFFLREQGLSEELIQSLLFLKLIIAGHSTIYVTRTEDWFWKSPWPSPLLLIATFGTEIIATLMTVYGILVTPIGWENALYIWLYALAWFLVNDFIKVSVHKMLNSNHASV